MAGVLIAANVIIVVLAMALSVLLPPPLPVNRRLPVAGSRFQHTPLPGTPMAPVSAAVLAAVAGEPGGAVEAAGAV